MEHVHGIVPQLTPGASCRWHVPQYTGWSAAMAGVSPALSYAIICHALLFSCMLWYVTPPCSAYKHHIHHMAWKCLGLGNTLHYMVDHLSWTCLSFPFSPSSFTEPPLLCSLHAMMTIFSLQPCTLTMELCLILLCFVIMFVMFC